MGPVTTAAQGAELAVSGPLERMLAAAVAAPEWGRAESLTGRLLVIREQALKQGVASVPVSDRYVITLLGGPVDLVHFLGLAGTVCSGKMERKAALMDQWRREGGPDHEAGLTGTYPVEAHPDDLPSNALGALFGEELRAHNGDLTHDVAGDLRRFFAGLQTVPDAVAQRFSHDQVVMGLRPGAPLAVRRARSEWFTALPLYVVPLVAPGRMKEIPDAASALRAAGLEVRPVEGRMIGIERVGVGRSPNS